MNVCVHCNSLQGAQAWPCVVPWCLPLKYRSASDHKAVTFHALLLQPGQQSSSLIPSPRLNSSSAGSERPSHSLGGHVHSTMKVLHYFAPIETQTLNIAASPSSVVTLGVWGSAAAKQSKGRKDRLAVSQEILKGSCVISTRSQRSETVLFFQFVCS